MSEGKRKAWFADQYQHPHESKHTIGEVLRWFDEEGIEFVRGVPSVTGEEGEGRTKLFTQTGRGTSWSHFLVQARQIVGGSREGGFFIMIGRRRWDAEIRERARPSRAAAAVR
jgi:hypothetical protein